MNLSVRVIFLRCLSRNFFVKCNKHTDVSSSLYKIYFSTITRIIIYEKCNIESELFQLLRGFRKLEMCHPLLSGLFCVELNETDVSKFRNNLVHFLSCHWSVEELSYSKEKLRLQTKSDWFTQ